MIDIEAALGRAEEALSQGRGLEGTGFWRAVDQARRDRAVAQRFADRIAAIDRAAFQRGVRLRVPAPVGLAVLGVITAVGVVAVVVSTRSDTILSPLALLVGLGALIVGTHSLAHWIVGRIAGMRFTHVFLGGPPPPRPGVKTDYATYLAASPVSRAVMHASGAVVTKLIPFALLPFALRDYERWPWLVWVVIAIGVIQIVTDIALSTKISDWMKVRRELGARGT